MVISENAAVLFHYTLTDEEGTQLDSSINNQPLAYLHGHGHIIPGLENAMEGKQVGDTMVVTVEAADAYGERREEMVQKVPRTSFPVETVEVGQRFEAQTPNGPMAVVIIDTDDETVTVDANHPLAGKALTFDVKIESVRQATEEELAQGQVDPNCCDTNSCDE